MKTNHKELQRVWNILGRIDKRQQAYALLNGPQKNAYMSRVKRMHAAGFNIYAFPKHKLP